MPSSLGIRDFISTSSSVKAIAHERSSIPNAIKPIKVSVKHQKVLGTATSRQPQANKPTGVSSPQVTYLKPTNSTRSRCQSSRQPTKPTHKFAHGSGGPLCRSVNEHAIPCYEPLMQRFASCLGNLQSLHGWCFHHGLHGHLHVHHGHQIHHVPKYELVRRQINRA